MIKKSTKKTRDGPKPKAGRISPTYSRSTSGVPNLHNYNNGNGPAESPDKMSAVFKDKIQSTLAA